MKMDQVGDKLQWIFIYILYPVLIVGIFFYILISISLIVAHGGNPSSKARRLTGSLLPVILLIFITITEDLNRNTMQRTVFLVSNFTKFFIGAVIGIALLEFGNIFARSNNDVGAAVYAMFLSALGVFILYSIMQGALSDMHYLLFGIVVFGGLDIVFRGPPII